MHGYKNVTLDFSGPVRIVIAENGMGKTFHSTLSNAVLLPLKNLWSFIRKIFPALLIQVQKRNYANYPNLLKLTTPCF